MPNYSEILRLHELGIGQRKIAQQVQSSRDTIRKVIETSYIGNALGNNACDELYKVFYRRMFEFISDLNQARLIGNEAKILKKYTRMDVLIMSLL